MSHLEEAPVDVCQVCGAVDHGTWQTDCCPRCHGFDMPHRCARLDLVPEPSAIAARAWVVGRPAEAALAHLRVSPSKALHVCSVAWDRALRPTLRVLVHVLVVVGTFPIWMALLLFMALPPSSLRDYDGW